MLPTSSAALSIALLAIVPGFIATATWARARTWKGPSGDLRTILQSLALSAAIQVVISPLTVAWIVPIRKHLADHPGRVATWFLIAVLVVPLGLGLAAARLTDVIFRPVRPREDVGWFRRTIARVVRAPAPPSAWDWLFANRPPNGEFVLVQFKDGSQVGGVFAEGSVSLTSPEPQGLFLVSEWQLTDDGDFIAPIPGSDGILVPLTDDIRWVRVLTSGDERSPSGLGDENG
jgi:hypothetical protein